MDTLIIAVVALAFAVARFLVPVKGVDRGDFFKDMAHLAVGFMFGYAAYAGNRIDLWALPIALTVVEVVAFVVRK